jgi:hypothetical protein
MKAAPALCLISLTILSGCNRGRDPGDVTSPTIAEKHEENQSQANASLSRDLPIEDPKRSVKTETDSQATEIRFVSECLGPAPVDGQLIGDF